MIFVNYFFRVSHNGFNNKGQAIIEVSGFYAESKRGENFIKMNRMEKSKLKQVVNGEWNSYSYSINSTNGLNEILSNIQSFGESSDIIQYVVL